MTDPLTLAAHYLRRLADVEDAHQRGAVRELDGLLAGVDPVEVRRLAEEIGREQTVMVEVLRASGKVHTGRESISLTPWQVEELRRFADGEPHAGPRPSSNLIRRNLLTLAPPHGEGRYRLTEVGRAALDSYLETSPDA